MFFSPPQRVVQVPIIFSLSYVDVGFYTFHINCKKKFEKIGQKYADPSQNDNNNNNELILLSASAVFVVQLFNFFSVVVATLDDPL